MDTLRPMGRLHFVGAVPEPVSFPVFSMLFGQKSVSFSPLGSPKTVSKMLYFAVENTIEPLTESYAMENVNLAIEKLRSGKQKYHIVLLNPS
jgi:uncharacterized zinc-type alcohol dehydrogenase-like protein